MSDDSSSTYIIVTEENIMNCEVIPYCESQAQALEGCEGPADGFALSPEGPEQPPPGCEDEAVQSHHTHVGGQSGCGCGGLRSGAVSGCVGDAGRADSIWDSVAVAGVKEKHTDA